MSESAHSPLRALVKLIGAVAVAGVLVALMLLPFVGGAGLVARNSSTLLDALPVELTDKTPNGNTRVLAANGDLITEFYENNRQPVTWDQISEVMKQAIVDIEDSRFYEHNGLDVQGTARALAKNVASGEIAEGGSTLTQQLVKQTLLETATTQEEKDAAIEQDGVEGISRKLREARLALALEQTYSKEEILTRYLNIAYFGHGAYGIQAASQTYFSVNAIDLTLPQASVLAGLVQRPGDDDPLINPDRALTRRNAVLNRMHELGHITDQELADVSASPIQTAEGSRPPNGCAYATIGGFFCDYLHGYLNNTLGLTDSELENGGYTIQTTLRPDLQRSGDQAVLETLPLGDPLVGTFTAVEPGTGHLLAMSNNRRYGCDRNVDASCESVNFNAVASKGAGSTYKVFTAAAALAQGYGQNYTITTPARYVSKVYKDGPGPYDVENASPNYPNTLNMADALVRSSNTYFLALEDALGRIDEPVQMAQAMGMRFDRSNQKPAEEIIAEQNGAFTLGPYATSPLDLTSAYSTLAAGGTQCDPTPLTQVLTSAGEPLLGDDGQPVVKNDQCTPEAIPPGVANTLNQILIADVSSPIGTATRAAIPGHQISGKTGTAQGNVSVAFVGSTPKYTAGVMVFNPIGNQNVGGFGGGKGATIWHDAMEPILTAEPNVDFPPADPAVVAGNRPTVPGCGSVDACTTTLQQSGFRPVTSQVNSSQPAGTFLGTSPRSGAQVSAGQVVTIQVSNGSGYTPPAPNTPDPSTPAPVESPAPPADQPVVPPDTNGDGQPG